VRGELQSTPTREGDRLRSSTTIETTINGLIAGIPEQQDMIASTLEAYGLEFWPLDYNY